MNDYPPGNLVAESVRAVRYLNHQSPIVLAFYPWARMNPYQALVYSEMWSSGVAPVPILDIAELDGLPVSHAATVFHLHWTTEIIGDAGDESLARDRVDAFLARLDSFVSRGGRFLWTVHNVMPHVCAFPDVEAELRQQLAVRAHAIHMHCGRTLEAAQDHYELPADRAEVVPHPSYGSFYDHVASRDQARFELDLNPLHTVLGAFGAMKPYKGLDRLASAFSRATATESGHSLRLLVAGGVDPRDCVDSFVDWAQADPLVTADFRKVPRGDLQQYLAATDVAVLPYLKTLNSGVALMALSQGIPLIAPDAGCLGDLVTPETGIRFDPDDDDDFVAALLRAPELRSSAYRAAARAKAEEFAPEVISPRLAEVIRNAIEG